MVAVDRIRMEGAEESLFQSGVGGEDYCSRGLGDASIAQLADESLSPHIIATGSEKLSDFHKIIDSES